MKIAKYQENRLLTAHMMNKKHSSILVFILSDYSMFFLKKTFCLVFQSESVFFSKYYTYL